MNFLESILDLASLRKLGLRRHDQIKDQERLDLSLGALIPRCGNSISLYLLLQRNIIRRQQLESNKSAISEYPKIFEKHLDQNDEILKQFTTIFESKNPDDRCQQIDAINNKIIMDRLS